MVNKEYAEIGDITLPIMQRYCNRHGYGMEVGLYHTDPNRLGDYGDRGKIDVFNQHHDAHDIIMFLDVDALIMNHDIRIEEVLSDRNFLWTYHVGGPCSGFWIARTGAPVHLALNVVKNTAPLVGNVRTLSVPGPPAKVVLEMEPTGQSDQEVMRSLMNVPPYDFVFGGYNCASGKEAGHCFDYRAIGWPSAYDYLGHYEPGDWLLTFPSIPLERRIELLRAAALEAM